MKTLLEKIRKFFENRLIDKLEPAKPLSGNTYDNITPDMLDYLENAGLNVLKEKKGIHDKLREDSRKTLTLFLSGTGLAFAFAVGLISKGEVLATVFILIACFWLCFCACAVLATSVQTQLQPPVYCDPKALYTQWAIDHNESVIDNRKRALAGIQNRINNMHVVNHEMASGLDNSRWLATLIPVLLLIYVIVAVATSSVDTTNADTNTVVTSSSQE